VIDRVKKGEGGFLFIDVRQPAEVASGMIEGALLIPTQDLPRRLEELEDKDAEIFVYCASGVRSLDAAMFMREKGFGNTLSLGGGIAHWQADGGEIVVPD
jgi:rhodanese-related sulfurtransferase